MRSELSLALRHVRQQQNWGANASWAKTRLYYRWRDARSGCIVNARTPITSIDVPDADARPIGDGTLSLSLTKRTAPDAAAGWKIKGLHEFRGAVAAPPGAIGAYRRRNTSTRNRARAFGADGSSTGGSFTGGSLTGGSLIGGSLSGGSSSGGSFSGSSTGKCARGASFDDGLNMMPLGERPSAPPIISHRSCRSATHRERVRLPLTGSTTRNG